MTKSLALAQLGEIRKYLESPSTNINGFIKINTLTCLYLTIEGIQTIKE